MSPVRGKLAERAYPVLKDLSCNWTGTTVVRHAIERQSNVCLARHILLIHPGRLRSGPIRVQRCRKYRVSGLIEPTLSVPTSTTYFSLSWTDTRTLEHAIDSAFSVYLVMRVFSIHFIRFEVLVQGKSAERAYPVTITRHQTTPPSVKP